MTTELPLVVGVDGSDGSMPAVDWAADEAALHGLPLRLVHGSLWERYETSAPSAGPPRPPGRAMADHIVACAAERAARRHPGVPVTTGVLLADAADALLHEGNNATALITGSRGRGGLGPLLLGSVALAVAARAHCPVIVVRGGAGPAGPHDRVLLGAGDPATGAEAARFAFREAENHGCVLDAVRAWRCPAREAAGADTLAEAPGRDHELRARAELDALLRDLTAEHPGVRTQRTTVEGPAGTVLVHRSAVVRLVIVGARRRQGHCGLQLGRVAHTLLHHAGCPVAVVPQRV
ncbi:universal stress protein [Streptomyces sp. NPDC052693]|uniref:universal stress protein n=1 Tax=Streptomyces sp. NPDC052693 TaxID=3155814 RepID=UPI003427A885